MKLLLISMLTVFAMQAHATKLKDILIPVIVGAVTGQNPYGPYPYPGHPGRPGHPGHPGHGHPGHPGHPGHGHPGHPGHPGRPPAPYPGYPPPAPGYGHVQCSASDVGWEEHAGGHFSCGECVRWHGQCVETCRQVAVDCQAVGTDAYGRQFTFLGRGADQWRAQDDAVYQCRSRYLNNCYVANCQQRQNVVSQRSCR